MAIGILCEKRKIAGAQAFSRGAQGATDCRSLPECRQLKASSPSSPLSARCVCVCVCVWCMKKRVRGANRAYGSVTNRGRSSLCLGDVDLSTPDLRAVHIKRPIHILVERLRHLIRQLEHELRKRGKVMLTHARRWNAAVPVGIEARIKA